MSSQPKFFTDTKLAIEDYIQSRILLLKLQAVEKISKLCSAVFAGLLMAILGFFVILFVSIMAAYYFATLTGSVYVGFAIISGFYLLLLILLIIFKKQIFEKVVTSLAINLFFDKTSEDHGNNNASE